MWGLIGLDKKSYYEGEAANGGLNAQGTKLDWDLGDKTRHAWSHLFGMGDQFSQEAVLRGARDVQDYNINNDPRLSETNIGISQYTPGAEPIQRRAGETLAQTRGRATAQLGLGQRISQAKANNPGIDLAGVTSVSDVDSRVSAEVARKRKEEQGKIDARTKIQDDRHEAGLLRDYNLQLRQLNGQIAQETARLRAEEKADLRAHEATLRGYDNQLASFNLENARMMQQEENRRADRKEKALYTLIASLSNLGSSFAI